MPLLYLLPLSTGICFIVSLALILINSKGKDKKYISLYCLMLGTTLAIALIETILIYKYHGLDNGIINDKLVFFLIGVVTNLLALLSKIICVIKELKKENPDYAGTTLKIRMVDPLCLGILIMMIIVFRV